MGDSLLRLEDKTGREVAAESIAAGEADEPDLRLPPPLQSQKKSVDRSALFS
jgi:hypothetical protein